MRKFYLALIGILFHSFVFSQTDILIGTGTTGNTGTTYPAPIQDYYEGSRAQYLYLASELTAAGMTPGVISSIKYEVTSLNTFAGTVEQLSISIGGTSTTTLGTSTWESGATQVFGPVDYAATVGTNVFAFTTPFIWNGSDNIVIEICNGDPNNGTYVSYTQNPTVSYTTGLSFNGSHTYRADNLGNLCGSTTTTNTGSQTTRPNITFEWTPSSTTGCYLPTGLAVANVAVNTADVSWNAPTVGTPASGYNWELRTSGAAGSGSTGLVSSASTAATAVSLTALTSNTTYTFYVQSNCGTGNLSSWSGGNTFTTLPSCIEPNTILVSNIATTSAQLDWTAPATSTPASYEIYYSTTNTAPTSSTVPTITGVTGTTYNFTTLTSATTYYVWIRSNCGSGDVSIWSTVASFSTQCVAVTDFYQNFDSVITPALPVCWAKVGTGGLANTQTTNPNSLPNTLYIYSGSTASQAVVSMVPVSNAAANTHQLRFSLRANFTVGATLQVGYLTDPADATTFVSLQDFTTTSLTYQTFTVVPGAISTGSANTVFAFRHAGNQAYSVLVDDIYWEPVPSCVEPNTLVVSNITSTGAQLDWTAPAASSPASYDVYYSTTSTAPTSTTTPSATGLVATTYNVTALASATKYFVWVRSNCGSGGLSGWSVADSFVTACLASPLFSENFNSVAIPALPTCWSSILRGATLSTFATITTTASNANSSPNAVTMYNSSSTATDDIILVSPPVSNLALGTYQLSFYAKNSTTGEDVEVGTLDNNSATAIFTPLQTVALSTAYQKYSVSFASYTGSDMYIGIRRVNASTFSYVYLDDISWELIPSCVEPNTLMVSNITATGAQLDWTAPATGSPASYDVYYSTTNTAPTSTTTPSATGVTATTYNLTALTAASTYYVWVRSNCGAGGVSIWSQATTFATQCNATNVPYAQDFESAVTPALPICTSNENVGTGNNWAVAAAPGNGFTSKTLEYVYNFSNPADAWFYTQGLNLTAGVSYRLKFRYGNNSTTYVESMNVSYGDVASAASMTNTIIDYPSVTGGTASVSSTDFTPTTTGVYYIGFHVYSIANQYNLYVDDINVDVTPTCNEPTDLLVSNITATSAQLDWTAPTASTPASYDVYYSTTSTAPTSATTPSASGLTTTTYNLTALASSSTYYVWVRSNCGTSGVSSWSISASFATLCTAVNLPYTQNFDSTTAPSLPICTSSQNVGNGNDWTVVTNPGNGFTSNALRYQYNSTSSADAWFYTPGFNLQAGVSYRLEFNYGNNSTTYVESMNVSYGDAASATAMTNVIVDYPSITGGVLAMSATDFVPTTTGTYYIGFHAYSIADQYNLYVDDINVKLTATSPVTLVNFKGEKQGAKNLLTWNTATEQRNKGFELQRSNNGRDFSTIAFVQSKGINGASSASLNYGFTDEKPFTGDSYYRLKQVDFDGKSTLSNVVLIKGNRPTSIVLSSVYPNPAKNQLNVILSAPANDKISLVVTDVAGKVLMQKAAQLVAGDNNLTINVSELPSGTYMIKAICNNGCETSVSKFLKQ